jgi:hypothetical protein
MDLLTLAKNVAQRVEAQATQARCPWRSAWSIPASSLIARHALVRAFPIGSAQPGRTLPSSNVPSSAKAASASTTAPKCCAVGSSAPPCETRKPATIAGMPIAR